MYKRMKNFGICEVNVCMIHGPRCASNLCVFHCRKTHEYWLLHVMADGTDSPVTQEADARRQGVAVKSEPERVPEPGKIEESGEDQPVFVPMSDTSRIGGTKTNFPIKYVV